MREELKDRKQKLMCKIARTDCTACKEVYQKELDEIERGLIK